MTRSAAGHVLRGRFGVPLPPGEAFELFTPRGERRWVPGWRPEFPAWPDGESPDDDSAPGTVFQTRAHGRVTTWVVVERDPGRRIRYARVVPGVSAGTVTVLVNGGAGGSEVTVTYELTALGDAGAEELGGFAAGYAGFLRSWEGAIATALRCR